MHHLPLRTLIPLAAASALVTIGCGGKATDGVVGDGDQNGTRQGDPLSDANFQKSIDVSVDKYCDNVHSCGDFESQRECVDLIDQAFERVYDTESRNCRAMILDAFDCVNESWRSCSDYGDGCDDVSDELSDECVDYDYSDYDF